MQREHAPDTRPPTWYGLAIGGLQTLLGAVLLSLGQPFAFCLTLSVWGSIITCLSIVFHARSTTAASGRLPATPQRE